MTMRQVLVRGSVLAVVLGGSVAVAGSASAATIQVGGACSLQDALVAAASNTPTGGCAAGSGSDVIVLEAGVTYPGPLTITAGHLVVEGSGATLDANGAGTVLTAAAGSTVTLENLTVTGGLGAAGTTGPDGSDQAGYGTEATPGEPGTPGHAGGIENAGTLTLRNVAVTSNAGGAGGDGGKGGSISVQGFGEPGGVGGVGGAGGIRNTGTLTLEDATVQANTGGAGGRAGSTGNSNYENRPLRGAPGVVGGEGGAGGVDNVGALHLSAAAVITGNHGGAGGRGGNGGKGAGGRDMDDVLRLQPGGAGGAGGDGGAGGVVLRQDGTLGGPRSTVSGNTGGSGGPGGTGGIGGDVYDQASQAFVYGATGATGPTGAAGESDLAGDSTPPTVGITLTGPNDGIPNGSHGWFVSAPVTGMVTATDTGSGVASIDCTASRGEGSASPLTFRAVSGLATADAAGRFMVDFSGVTTVSCTATDGASNTTLTPATLVLKVDTGNPSLNDPSVAPNPVLLGGAATVSFAPRDTDSGVDAALTGCGTPSTSQIGTATVTCTVTDLAGRVTSGQVSYLVAAFLGAFKSPLPPTTLVKSGSSIPVKFTLRDAGGPLSATASAALASAGRVQAVLSGPGSPGSVRAATPCGWDSVGQSFLCVLKVPKGLVSGVDYFIRAQEKGVSGAFFDAPTSNGANPVPVRFK